MEMRTCGIPGWNRSLRSSRGPRRLNDLVACPKYPTLPLPIAGESDVWKFSWFEATTSALCRRQELTLSSSPRWVPWRLRQELEFVKSSPSFEEL